MLLEANGHLYDAKITTNMIIFEHRPDIGIKINEIVNNLKSDNRLDQELILFLSFLKGLKQIPDTPMSISVLGRRIGTNLMKEYEKDNNIKGWNLETFQKAFEMIDSKIHRESEWKFDGKNLLYRIRKCNIVSEGDNFDAYICRTAREAFKGALDYAFGSKAELDIKKLLTHGDNICEVSIKIKEESQ
jgi:predicted hydrocarbon binding protein